MRFTVLPILLSLAFVLSACQSEVGGEVGQSRNAVLSSLSDISIDNYRNRKYGAKIKIESRLDGPCVDAAKVKSLPELDGIYQSYMASYLSDNLRVYTRINIPDGPEPEGGFPVIVFAHGWVGAKNAPSYTMGCDFGSMYSEITDAYSRAGYIVFAPGYRGHATVNNVPGEGIEFLETWDNGTQLAPVMYAIDVMNLMAGLQSSGEIKSDILPHPIHFQTDTFNLSGHSQGGDVVLTVLASVGENAENGIHINKASIWSGAIADRMTQLSYFRAMGTSPESFLSGDGDWSGSGVGASGKINPNFIFAYPSEYVETLDLAEWTHQKDTWKYPTVKEAWKQSFKITYATFNENVEDITDAKYSFSEDAGGKTIVNHDTALQSSLQKAGGFNFPEYITEPIILHFPDRDYISPPEWNYDLCQRIDSANGNCTTFEYPENNHGMRLSKYKWFSSEKAVDGYAYMVARDVAFFNGHDPRHIDFPGGKK